MELFHDTSLKTSAIVTKNYSNSFYLSTLLLDKRVKTAIHSIYGSANVVGLMCLKVFCKENTKLFGELVASAEMLDRKSVV